MNVRLTPAARDDIAFTYDNLARYSPKFAARIEQAIFDAISVLQNFPRIGVLTDETDVHRWLIAGLRHAIFYRISDDSLTCSVLSTGDACGT
jgi:plasmid stabilization system protein ParE